MNEGNDDCMTLQIEIFRGEENMVTLNQTHSKMFHCTYLLHYYPFDTQVTLHILIAYLSVSMIA